MKSSDRITEARTAFDELGNLLYHWQSEIRGQHPEAMTPSHIARLFYTINCAANQYREFHDELNAHLDWLTEAIEDVDRRALVRRN